MCITYFNSYLLSMDSWQSLLGLSQKLLLEMKNMAKAGGFEYFLVPVRPYGKANYPLHSLAEYTCWLREDGLPLDPWLRTHVKNDGEILLPMEHCHMLSGSIDEWAKSTNLTFQSSGQFIVPRALSPLFVDLETGLGTLTEGNVWVSYPLI